MIQQYLNHDERIFKIYVMGEQIQINQKGSSPNISYETVGEDCIFFDSQISFSKQSKFKDLLKGFKESEIELKPISIIAKEISEKFSFTLFGFDLIRESSSGKFYLIDLNYFPGFSGVKEFRDILHKIFVSKAQKFLKK